MSADPLHGACFRAAKAFWPDKHLFFYGLAKSVSDPAYRHVARGICGSRLPLLDLGCGPGLLASYLRACGYEGSILGMDADAKKIALARRVLAGRAAEFVAADASDPPVHSGHVAALDVLHYFAPEVQAHLIARIAASLAPGGRAWIRVTLRDNSLRFAATRLEEWFVQKSGWIPLHGSHFPTRSAIQNACPDLPIRLFPMWGATPFNSYMLEIDGPPEP
jgi:SAM-dependent methyltransferase